MKLHKIMMKHFSFRIDKKSAKEQTLGDAIKETYEGIQYLFLIVAIELIVNTIQFIMNAVKSFKQ